MVGVEFNATSTTSGATLINNYNGTATLAGAIFPEGTTLVTWTASQTIDGTLYTNDCSFYVFVSDNEDPVITPQADIVTTDIIVSSGCYSNTVDLGIPTITDNCGISYYENNAPSVYYLGTTNVTWWVVDIHGNTSTAVQQVTVVDEANPDRKSVV